LFTLGGPVAPGDVIVLGPEGAPTLRRADREADPAVLGVVVAPDLLGAATPLEALAGAIREGTGETALVALGGIVPCHADADYGAIHPGDLLMTSPTPGHAMRASSVIPGAVIGKALESLEAGTGLIHILVLPR